MEFFEMWMESEFQDPCYARTGRSNMKIMSQLTVIASDLYESVSTEINEPTKTLIAEFMEDGEVERQ